MEWKDVYKILEGSMPRLKNFAVTGSTLKAHTKKNTGMLEQSLQK